MARRNLSWRAGIDPEERRFPMPACDRKKRIDFFAFSSFRHFVICLAAPTGASAWYRLSLVVMRIVRR
jgi:hypothetical protein